MRLQQQYFVWQMFAAIFFVWQFSVEVKNKNELTKTENYNAEIFG